jgi:hypothetical protein
VDDFRQVTGLDQATGDDTVRLARTAATYFMILIFISCFGLQPV